MKTKFKHILALTCGSIALLAISESPVSARSVPNLANFFEQKIQKLEQAMAAVENRPSANPGKPIVMENINIDIIPTVSIGISEVLQLKIMPEIDFVLQPDAPETAPKR